VRAYVRGHAADATVHAVVADASDGIPVYPTIQTAVDALTKGV